MKKSVFALASVIYLLLSSGLTFSVHYCMGERDAFKLGTAATKICGRCGMDEQSGLGCCKDVHFIAKLSCDQQSHISGPMPQPPVAVLPPAPIPQYTVTEQQQDETHLLFADISPPPLLVSRNILFSNFRI